MCNGSSTRPSYGGAIAILKPASDSSRPGLSRGLSFGMNNSEHGKTTAIINGLGSSDEVGKEVLIHRDGDLRSKTTTELSILHRIELPKHVAPGVPFSLDKSLDLNVGGEGIIGRRVSLVEDGTVIGEGIVGWN